MNIIQEFITVILRKLIYDSSSPDVRAQVVKGLAVMLDNSQTHQLLEKMIPLTNKVLHDPHDKVNFIFINFFVLISFIYFVFWRQKRLGTFSALSFRSELSMSLC